jgi:Pyruvate/2-oxoacid:ferredoxin oxidoreductase delta subunit
LGRDDSSLIAPGTHREHIGNFAPEYFPQRLRKKKICRIFLTKEKTRMLKSFKTSRTLPVVLILCFMAAMAISLVIASDAGTESRIVTGTVSYNKDRCILQTGKTKLQLAILPRVALDSLEFEPDEGDTITVSGFMSHGILVVQDATWKGLNYAFRDSLMQFTRPELGKWEVNQDKCIGCAQCYKNCPASAITMQTVKGRQKSFIDQTLCTGCNTCIAGNLATFKGCPVGAIKK